MNRRQLGDSGLVTSALGYGCMGISMAYGPADAPASIAAIQRAYDLGVTMFDTAQLYGWGENEKFVGRAIRGFREEVVLASKFGFSGEMGFDSRPENIRSVLDQSLRNLGVDHLDLYYQHRVDPAVPIEDVAGTVKELVEAGKVAYFGLSEAGPRTIRRAHAVQPVSVLQTEYSIFARNVETILPVLEELGIGLVAYSPLARGFLSGAVQSVEHYHATDARSGLPWWAPGNFERNHAIVERLTAVAQRKGVSLSQLALAWVLARGEHIVPIPGSRSPDRIEENVAAVNIQLTAEDLDAVAKAVGDGPYGARNTQGIRWV